MTVAISTVTFDCADAAALAGFWSGATGRPVDDGASEAFASIGSDGAGPSLSFAQVPEGKTAKNRVHLDVRAAPGLQGEERMAALEAECDRLVALGATRIHRAEPEPPLSGGHIVMADPEGNEFCLD